MKAPESLKLLYSKPPKTWSDDYTIINLSAYTVELGDKELFGPP